MLLKWEMLFQDFAHILVCYVVLMFGNKVRDEEPGLRVYEWRGRQYEI